MGHAKPRTVSLPFTDDRRIAAAREAMRDDAPFERAWQKGRALTLDQAIELALAAIPA
jgi:hypothetical protein